MRKLLAPAAGALICLAVVLTTIPSLASRDGGDAGFAGMYVVQMNPQAPFNTHDPFIFQGLSHNMTLNVIVDGPNVVIQGPAPWVTVTGTIDELGEIDATGSGTCRAMCRGSTL
jgi:hypothetical protein